MGRDIHTQIEVKKGKQWKAISSMEEHDLDCRYYDFFDWISEVVKAVPDDADKEGSLLSKPWISELYGWGSCTLGRLTEEAGKFQTKLPEYFMSAGLYELLLDSGWKPEEHGLSAEEGREWKNGEKCVALVDPEELEEQEHLEEFVRKWMEAMRKKGKEEGITNPEDIRVIIAFDC